MNQEKWNAIVQQIEELGEELQEIFDHLQLSDSDDESNEQIGNIETALMGLRMSVDELSEQEIPED
jgi:uncharacterized coiled-coil DUF342 family protein